MIVSRKSSARERVRDKALIRRSFDNLESGIVFSRQEELQRLKKEGSEQIHQR
jgi:hypothetical protein